ncbi:hypothetical protein JOD54_000395 [Actinokineospora baliensis]|uniref:hypothetical protein n=1 Tax=Actinokineospora baliensis TaxID=547056 RepID=UPI00195635BB|nr:hypothetical protein [Actinokineospora baliensis]MBM7770191.1 hypothetical protein [Actinokineospora baliensis]
MDRPTTGRRRVRSGSVRVAELIQRRPDAECEPVDAEPVFTPTVDPQPVRVVLDRAAHRTVDHRITDGPTADARTAGGPAERDPDSRAARLAKLTGLGVAVVTLCGAVAAATIVARDRDATRGAVAAAGQITGERALLPHQLGRAVTGADDAADTRFEPQSTGAASGSISPPPTTTSPVPSSSGQRRGDTSPAHWERGARPVTSNRELVLEYYRLIEINPRSAFELIAGDVLGTTLGEFLGSWTDVSRIEVLDVVERRDGVLAVLRLHLRDGVHLRVQQLLTVTRTAPQRIVGAELVSAQLD